MVGKFSSEALSQEGGRGYSKFELSEGKLFGGRSANGNKVGVGCLVITAVTNMCIPIHITNLLHNSLFNKYFQDKYLLHTFCFILG